MSIMDGDGGFVIMVSVIAVCLTTCTVTCIIYKQPETCVEWADGGSNDIHGDEFQERLDACLHERGVPQQSPEAP